ncbi:helicase-like protein [Tanacetum coccineum]
MREGGLQRINIFHPSYLPLQYPLLMPRGQDGYRLNIPHKYEDEDARGPRKTVTMREYFAYGIQDRPNEMNLFTLGRRVFQQFLVDGYTMAETERWYGCPDLFITITCNLNWPEVSRYMGNYNLAPNDRPDALSRV